MNELSLQTPVADIYTQYLKKIRHKHFEILENLEMRQVVFVEFYENDNGDFGRPLLQVIAEDENLTEQQRLQLKERFATTTYESKTVGSYVNPNTGELVEKDGNGNYPEGSIPELQYWQSLPIAPFASQDGLLRTPFYNALLGSMEKMVERNRV